MNRTENIRSEILTISLLPMFVTLVLGTEATMTCFTPGMFLSGLQVAFELRAATEPKKTDEARKLMARMEIVLEMVLQTPAILEGTQA